MAFSSCSLDDDDNTAALSIKAADLLGKWSNYGQTIDGTYEELDGSNVLEFMENGVVTTGNSEVTIIGTYSVSGDKLTVAFPTGSAVLKITKFTSTQMDVFVKEDGKEVTSHLQKI